MPFCLFCQLCPKPSISPHDITAALPEGRLRCWYPQSRRGVASTCSTARPVLSLGSIKVDSTKWTSCYNFVCRQLLVWLTVWPSSNLSGHMSWKSRVKGWGEKERLRGVQSDSTFSCLAVFFGRSQGSFGSYSIGLVLQVGKLRHAGECILPRTLR